MKNALAALAVCVALTAPGLAFAQAQANSGGQIAAGANLPAEAEQIFVLANHARRIAGVGQLQWDPALAAAALYHCRWMVQEGQIAHRYGGEPDLTTRAANAGARFGLIEENVAIGATAANIHEAWMNSPGHRANLLSPDVDSVGIAVIASRGVLYAAADYARAVPSLSAAQVEARVADLIRVSGIAIENSHAAARAACATDTGFPLNAAGAQPQFIDRWQSATLDQLPQTLVDKLSNGNYHSAAIGSCPAAATEGQFAAYRIAVLLY
ncbi:MAG: CAP domain-containing protein [Terracidiphilus sp.]|jgi:uncharacterized protein YkwD